MNISSALSNTSAAFRSNKIAFWACLSVLLAFSHQSAASLEQGFLQPPNAAKPKTWLHAMSGNMSKVGFTKDLEAIADAGIGGIFLFHVTHGIPTGTVRFHSEEHHDIVTHVAKESERLGLAFGIHNCDGWTSSGGPWNTIENSMKMVAWSESVIDGGNVNIKLPQPTAREGYYEDLAVIAYPALPAEVVDAKVRPKITSSDPKFDTSLITDQRWDKRKWLRVEKGKTGWIQFEYEKPHTINGVFMSLFKRISGSRMYTVEKSDDGKTFESLGRNKLKRLGKKDFAIDQVLPNVTARFFRIVIEDDYEVSEVALTHRPQYDQFLESVSLFKRDNHRIKPQLKADPALVINKKDIINLSKNLNSDGTLKTKLPKGKWTVLRFGFTTTSAKNGPASPEGRGFENDKMNRESFKIHYDAYMKKIIDNGKAVAPNALQYMEIDSFEVGGQNWTHGYEKLFEKEFNYSLLDFLPLYAGRIVQSPEMTAEVLWDIRRFNSKLITENYFGYFSELTHQDGLITYVEPYTFNAPFNEIDAGKYPDINMGEFWLHQNHENYKVGTAVSASRIYGKNIVSAESFTAMPENNWKTHPGVLKRVGDIAWALGINEFVFHRFAHQANTHVKPGMTMSKFGSHIDRHQTWWHNAGKAWFEYIARGSHILRQGVVTSDLLIYMGEGSPNSSTLRNSFNKYIPVSINFDNVNTDALLTRVQAKNGKLVLPDGTSYRALVLFNSNKLSMPSIKKIESLAKQGIVIIGKPPKELAGYRVSPKAQKEFEEIVKGIWNKDSSHKHFDWEKIFAKHKFTKDLQVPNSDKYVYIHRSTADEEIYFIVNMDNEPGVIDYHFNIQGKIPELWNPVSGEIRKLAHFESTKSGTKVSLDVVTDDAFFVVFRESIGEFTSIVDVIPPENQSLPELSINKAKKIEARAFADGEYALKLSNGNTKSLKVRKVPSTLELQNKWAIKFDKDFGYGETLSVNKLFDWRSAEDFDLKHYSGSAIYSTKFKVSGKHLKSNIVNELNLGDVHVAARVWINDKLVGTLWSKPYKIDVSEFLKRGENTLRVEVSNTWTNRLIGDEHYPRTDGYEEGPHNKMPAWYSNNEPMPPSKRQTFSAFDFYDKDDELMPSGLIGPVTIEPSKVVRIKDI